ncbi:reverse transcriptase domain-containing protein [Tanacetum coccineum]
MVLKKDCIGSVTTWGSLVEKFVKKFYQLSDDNKEMEVDEDDDPDDIAEIFKIDGNLFNYEAPLCKAFNDFNYLLKINTNLFTFDIQGIRTYEEYELNNIMTRDLEEPWLDNQDELADGKLKEETLIHKTEVKESWGDATPGVMKFYAWLKSSFENFHELYYNVLVKLEECWWKVNAHEVASFIRWENYRHGPYSNSKTERAYDPYLDINRIFGMNYGAYNADYTQDNQEHKKEHHDPSTFRVKRFEMIKYLFDVDDEDHVKSISTAKVDSSEIRRMGCSPYVVSGSQHRSIFFETVPFSRRLQNYCCDDWRKAKDVKILEAYDHTLPQKEKYPGSFTLPCFIYNVCFDKALVDLGASVSVMPFSTYTNLVLGILSHTRLTIELADPRGIAENVLVRIGKFTFPIDFIILDIPEDDDVPLILDRPFLSIAHSKIDVYKRKFTLRVREEKLVFKSIKPATSIIRRVFMLKDLDSKTKLIGEDDELFDLLYGNYIELNDLDTPLEPETNQDVNYEPTFVNEPDNVKTSSICCYKMKFSCTIGYKNVNVDYLLFVNLITKSFYYSIIKDKDAHEGNSLAGALIDIPVFIKKNSILTGFIIIDGEDVTRDVALGMPFL